MRDGRVIIIGAGIGGLAAAARLAHAGVPVTVLEQHAQPGGKMRTVPSDSGPVDAGPTVLTMRPVFEDLFESLGETLSFGRYATYVGGSPFQSPALLSLIWQAEAAGVWSVEGGMHQLAQTLEHLAKARGAVFHYNTPVARIVKQGGRVSQVVTDRDTFQADQVLFNGDPRALSTGLLGPAAEAAVTEKAVTPRSLSAHVMAFDAIPKGPELAHHTVFFADAENAGLRLFAMPHPHCNRRKRTQTDA